MALPGCLLSLPFNPDAVKKKDTLYCRRAVDLTPGSRQSPFCPSDLSALRLPFPTSPAAQQTLSVLSNTTKSCWRSQPFCVSPLLRGAAGRAKEQPPSLSAQTPGFLLVLENRKSGHGPARPSADSSGCRHRTGDIHQKATASQLGAIGVKWGRQPGLCRAQGAAFNSPTQREALGISS